MDLKMSIEENVNSTIALVQLINQYSFQNVKPNWSYHEYTTFRKRLDRENCSDSVKARAFVFVITDDLVDQVRTKKFDFKEPKFKDWYDHIMRTNPLQIEPPIADASTLINRSAAPMVEGAQRAAMALIDDLQGGAR